MGMNLRVGRGLEQLTETVRNMEDKPGSGSLVDVRLYPDDETPRYTIIAVTTGMTGELMSLPSWRFCIGCVGQLGWGSGAQCSGL